MAEDEEEELDEAEEESGGAMRMDSWTGPIAIGRLPADNLSTRAFQDAVDDATNVKPVSHLDDKDARRRLTRVEPGAPLSMPVSISAMHHMRLGMGWP